MYPYEKVLQPYRKYEKKFNVNGLIVAFVF